MAETATAETASTVHDNKGDLFASFDVADFPVPHAKDEVWRFVPLRRLNGLHDGSFDKAVPAQVSVEIPAGADGISHEVVSRDDDRIGVTGGGVDRVSAQAWTSSTEGHVITFKKNCRNEEPVVVTITGTGEGVTAFGNLVIEVEDGADAALQIHTVGTGTLADNHEYLLGDNARLTVVVHEDWDDGAVHLGSEVAQLGRDAVLRHNVALFGGSVVRLQPRVKFLAPGGDAELLGVYFADDGQFFEQRTLVDHAQPNCRSNVLYKGALQGDKSTRAREARTAWIGDVLIRSNAQGTDTYEANRNLVLTEGARADAVPNLEIETGNIVGAGHAATVGRFDDEQLFYLMSRGIPEGEARKLIVHGFFSEVIARIPVEGVRETLEAKINDELTGIEL